MFSLENNPDLDVSETGELSFGKSQQIQDSPGATAAEQALCRSSPTAGCSDGTATFAGRAQCSDHWSPAKSAQVSLLISIVISLFEFPTVV